jgi:hypothetical protein
MKPLTFTPFLSRALVAGGLVAAIGLTTSLPAAAASNLLLSATTSPQDPFFGSAFTYSLRITNPYTGYELICIQGGIKPYCYDKGIGTNTSGIVVNDTLPNGVTFISASGSAGSQFTCTHSGNTVSCANGSIPAGGSATITIQVIAPWMYTPACPTPSCIITNASAIVGGASATLQSTLSVPLE